MFTLRMLLLCPLLLLLTVWLLSPLGINKLVHPSLEVKAVLVGEEHQNQDLQLP